MSLEIQRGVVRDATRELTLAFQLSNFCRELTKAKIIPGSERILGRRTSQDGEVEEKPGDYGTPKTRHKSTSREK